MFSKIKSVLIIALFSIMVFAPTQEVFAFACLARDTDDFDRELCFFNSSGSTVGSTREKFNEACTRFCASNEGVINCQVEALIRSCPRPEHGEWKHFEGQVSQQGLGYMKIYERINTLFNQEQICIEEVEAMPSVSCEYDIEEGWSDAACPIVHQQCVGCRNVTARCQTTCEERNPMQPPEDEGTYANRIAPCVEGCLSNQPVCNYKKQQGSAATREKVAQENMSLRDALELQCLGDVRSDEETKEAYETCIVRSGGGALDQAKISACLADCVEEKLARTPTGCYCNVFRGEEFFNNRRIEGIASKGQCENVSEEGEYTLKRCEWVEATKAGYELEDGELISPELKKEVISLNRFGTLDIPTIIGRFIGVLLGIIGTITVSLLVYAGFLRFFGKSEWTKESNDILFWIIIAVPGIFLSYAIVNFIFTELF